MPRSHGTLRPFVTVNRSAELYQTVNYPVGGTTPAPVNGVTTVVTASLTAGSPQLNVTYVTRGKLVVGQVVSGPGIPTGTVILSQESPVNAPGQGSNVLGGVGLYRLSQNPTSTQANVSVVGSVAGSPSPNGPLPIVGPVPGYNCANMIDIRDYYNVPFPPSTPLASPPVIAVVSFGGGIYGQPVTSGKYAGFWKCTDISGQNGAPIQILVVPINGAINAPNADDGGATLENTVDVATINGFYGMIDPRRDAPIYTPPVIILFIAPSNDISEMYRTFYTVLKNPVVCNGKSYSPSVVCCSWGAPETSWTQIRAQPLNNLPVDTDPSTEGIAEINEINDLFAEATKNGINICVASGDISLDSVSASVNSYNYAQLLLKQQGLPYDTNYQNTVFPLTDAERESLAPPTVMFPASSPYVTCVGASAVYFPNILLGAYNNPAEFAWDRSEGGISTAFRIPEYQQNLPCAASTSAAEFLRSSVNTANLAVLSLGEPTYVLGDTLADISGVSVTGSSNVNVALATQTKHDMYVAAKAAFALAQQALVAAQASSNDDAVTESLITAVKAASTALATAEANYKMAEKALEKAEDLVVKTQSLDQLLATAASTFGNAAQIPVAAVNNVSAANAAQFEVQKAAYANLLNNTPANVTALLKANILNDQAQALNKVSQDAAKVLPEAVAPCLDVANKALEVAAGAVFAPAFADHPFLSVELPQINDTIGVTTLPPVFRNAVKNATAAADDVNPNVLPLSVAPSLLLDVYGINYSVFDTSNNEVGTHARLVAAVGLKDASNNSTVNRLDYEINNGNVQEDAYLLASNAMDEMMNPEKKSAGRQLNEDGTLSTYQPLNDASNNRVSLDNLCNLIAYTTSMAKTTKEASKGASEVSEKMAVWIAAKEVADKANADAQTVYNLVPAPETPRVKDVMQAALAANEALSAATVELARVHVFAGDMAAQANMYANTVSDILNSNNEVALDLKIVEDSSSNLLNSLRSAQQLAAAAAGDTTLAADIQTFYTNTMSGVDASGNLKINLTGTGLVVKDVGIAAAAAAAGAASVALADATEFQARQADWILASIAANDAIAAYNAVKNATDSSSNVLALAATAQVVSDLLTAITPTHYQSTPEATINTNDTVAAAAELSVASAAAAAAQTAMQLLSSTVGPSSAYTLNLAHAKVTASASAAACHAAALTAMEKAYNAGMRAMDTAAALKNLVAYGRFTDASGSSQLSNTMINRVTSAADAAVTAFNQIYNDGSGNYLTVTLDSCLNPRDSMTNLDEPSEGSALDDFLSAMKDASDDVILASGNTFVSFSANQSLVTFVPSLSSTANKAAADAKDALLTVLDAEGSILFTVSRRADPVLEDDETAADYAAAYMANNNSLSMVFNWQSGLDPNGEGWNNENAFPFAYKMSLPYLSGKIVRSAVAALHAGDYANAFASLAAQAALAANAGGAQNPKAPYDGSNLNAPFPAPNAPNIRGAAPAASVLQRVAQSLMAKQSDTALAAAKAVVQAKADVDEFGSSLTQVGTVTPSLLDAATSADSLMRLAADAAKEATSTTGPKSALATLLIKTEADVLACQTAAQAALESITSSDVRYASRLNMRNLWNEAVRTAIDALQAASEAPVAPGNGNGGPQPVVLTPLLDALAAAINAAWAATTLPETEVPGGFQNIPENVNSDAFMRAVVAHTDGQYIMNNVVYLIGVANNAIVAAWNAAQASQASPPLDASGVPVGGGEDAVTKWNAAAIASAALLSAVQQNGGVYDANDEVLLADMETLVAAVGPYALDPSGNEVVPTDASGVKVSAYAWTEDTEVKSSLAYTTAYDAWKKLAAASSDASGNASALDTNASDADIAKAKAQYAVGIALAAAARAAEAAKVSALATSALASNSGAYEDLAAAAAADAAYAASGNVNMYRCIPDVVMHGDADDLPIIFRLNGGNVYVGGTSVSAAMFAGFLAVTQSHMPINFFVNPVLYNNYTYPSPLFNDISGSSEMTGWSGSPGQNPSVQPPRLANIVVKELSGRYNTTKGLGSIKAMNLAAFLEVPEQVTAIYPTNGSATVYPGTQVTVTAYIVPPTAYNTNVVWSCNSPYNATVSQTNGPAVSNNGVNNMDPHTAYDPYSVSNPDNVTTNKGFVLDSMGNQVLDADENPIPCVVCQATITGIAALPAGSPLPVVTVASTDGSNVFGTFSVTVAPAKQVTGVSISALGEITNPSNTNLFLGTTLQLVATVTPPEATNKAVFWWSSNTAVVNVDASGLITSLAPGSATIKATTLNNNISASINVYVPTPITGLSVLPTTITLNPNMDAYPLKNSSLLRAIVTPANADYKHLTWTVTSSSQHSPSPAGITDVISVPQNGTVLSMDSNGDITDNTQAMVTAVSNGTATITVSTYGVPYGVYGTYSANIIVNVVTPISDVKMAQTDMVIMLNPETAQHDSDRSLPESYQVTATLHPAYPSNMNVFWSSSNPKVAVISNNTPAVLNMVASDPNFGLWQITETVTPLANGTTVIKVTTADGNKSAMTTVVVTTPVTGVAMSDMPVTINPGKGYTLQATILPPSATNKAVFWESTNTAVATVDDQGVVTGVTSGSCGISATTQDGDFSAITQINVVTPLVGVQLLVNTPLPIHVNDVVQILVVMVPTTASNQQFNWTVTNGVNGAIFSTGPAQNGNIVYLDAVQAGSAVFTVTTQDGNKQASINLTVVPY